MSVGRYDHYAVLLPDGRILIAGGQTRGQDVREVEIFDPKTGTFSVNGKLSSPCIGCPIALLDDGRVVIGGRTPAEIYDPRNGSSQLLEIPIPFGATPFAFPERRIFFLGAPDGLSGIYDLASDSYRPVELGSAFPIYIESFTQLPDGRILVADGEFNRLISFQLDPARPAQSEVVLERRLSGSGNSATTLADGSVLLYGGIMNYDGRLVPNEIFDPSTNTSRLTPAADQVRYHQATLLLDGTVLITGGCTDEDVFPIGVRGCYASAALFVPPSPAPPPVAIPNRGSQGAILHAGTARVATPADPAEAGEILEIFAVGLLGGCGLPPRAAIGGEAAEVLFCGAAPGYPDLFQINVRVPARVRPGSEVAVRLHYLGRPSNEVTIGVRAQ